MIFRYPLLFEQMLEAGRYHGFKLHALSRYGMEEAQHGGMQAQPVQGVVAVAVFHVSAYRMADVGGMHPYLVLAPGFKPVFHKTVLGGPFQRVKMGHGVFPSVVRR